MDFSTMQRLKLYKAEFDTSFKNTHCEKALRAICNAIDLAPDDISLYLNRANCYTQLGQTTKAIEDAEFVITAEPNDHRGYRARADALLYQGEFEFGLIDYYRCIEMRPDLGEHETGVKRCEDAVRKAILYDTKDIDLLMELLELGVIVESAVSHSANAAPFELWSPPELPEEEDIEGSQSLGTFLLPMGVGDDEATRRPRRSKRKPAPTDDLITGNKSASRSRSAKIPFFDLGDDKQFLRELQSIPLVKDLAETGVKYIGHREQYWGQLAKKEYAGRHTGKLEQRGGSASLPKNQSPQSMGLGLGRSQSAKVIDTNSYNRRRLLEATKSGSNIRKLMPHTAKASTMVQGSVSTSPRRSESPTTHQLSETVVQTKLPKTAAQLDPKITAAIAMSEKLRTLNEAQNTSVWDNSQDTDGTVDTCSDSGAYEEYVVQPNTHAKRRSVSESARTSIDPMVNPYLQKQSRITKSNKLMHSAPRQTTGPKLRDDPAVPQRKPASVSRPPKTRNRTIELSITDKRDYIGGVAGLAAETRSSSIRSQAFSRYILNTVTAEALASKRSKVNPVTLAQEVRTLETWISEKKAGVFEAVNASLLHDSIKMCKEVLERVCKGDRVSKGLANLPYIKAHFYLYLGCTYFLLDQRQTDHSRSCLASLKNAVDYANCTKDSILILQAVRELSKAMLNMGQASKAIVPLKSLLRHFEEIPLLEADTLLCIGRAYHDGGDYLNGLTYTHEALSMYNRLYVNEDELPIDFPGKRCKYTVFTELSPRHNYCFCLCLIGRCHLAQNDKALAKKYLEHCKSLGKLWKDSTAWHTATELLRFIY